MCYLCLPLTPIGDRAYNGGTMKETKAHDIRTRFGRNVAAERARRDLSQQELSDEAGIARNYLSRIERGASSPTVHVAVWLADALGVTTSHLTEERMSTDYILQKLDTLKEHIRNEGRSREELAERVEAVESALGEWWLESDDQYSDYGGDALGKLMDMSDKVDAIADHIGGLEFDEDAQVWRIEEARDGTDG